MNYEQLKNSILQEAIEGRLVPQDPNDEPASVLLDRIAAEKERLVKAKKIILSKPEKKVKQIAEKDLEIPVSWVWCNLNDICRVFGRIGFRGYTKADLRTKKEDGAISLSPSNMVNGKMVYEPCTYISEEKYEESPEIMINNGDVLIVKTGSSYGKTVLVENLPWKSTINPQIAVIKDIKIDKKYFTYFLQSSYAQSKFKEFVLGTSIPTFSQYNLISMGFPLPPMREQHRIVEKLETILPKVEEYGKAQDRLDDLNAQLPEKLKASILQEAIEGRLVPQNPDDEPATVLLDKIEKEKAVLIKEKKIKPDKNASRIYRTPDGHWMERFVDKNRPEVCIDDEIPFEIPQNWQYSRMSFFINLLSGRDLQPKDYQDKEEQGTLPYITGASNFTNGKLIQNRWTKNPVTISHKGDLLITCKGTIGSMAFNNIGDIQIARQVMAISAYSVELKYLKFFIEFNIPSLEKKAVSMIPGISREDMLNLIVPIPPISEQHRIVEKLETILPKLKVLNR